MRPRLLERIRGAREGQPPPGDGPEALISSIRGYLNLLLNTRQGSSASAPDFGTPDIESLTSQTDPESLRELARIVAEVVRRYEPRLKSPALAWTPSGQDSGIVEFSLSGSIDLDKERRNLFFSTSIDPDGRVVVGK